MNYQNDACVRYTYLSFFFLFFCTSVSRLRFLWNNLFNDHLRQNQCRDKVILISFRSPSAPNSTFCFFFFCVFFFLLVSACVLKFVFFQRALQWDEVFRSFHSSSWTFPEEAKSDLNTRTKKKILSECRIRQRKSVRFRVNSSKNNNNNKIVHYIGPGRIPEDSSYSISVPIRIFGWYFDA